MISQSDFVQPPRIAAWLVTLFTPAEQAESIPGDLLEEFSQIASKSGVAFARKWYWRQTVKTVAHLAGSGFRVNPWSSVAAIVVGFLLIRLGFSLYGQAFETILDRYGVYEYVSDLGRRNPSLDVSAYVYWISCCKQLIGRTFVLMTTGCIVAVAAKGREMATTMGLALFMSALTIVGCVMMLARTGDYAFVFLWALPSMLADSILIVAGGAIVRTRRSAVATRSSVT